MSTDITPDRLTQEGAPLEQLLASLQKFGQVSCHSFNDGSWFCSVEMVMRAKGSDYKIWSDLDHATPRAAIEQCTDRVNEAIQAARHLLCTTQGGES